jgi:hypothetical protein
LVRDHIMSVFPRVAAGCVLLTHQQVLLARLFAGRQRNTRLVFSSIS